MKLKEAITLLDTAPVSDKPSRVNPNLTQAQTVQIIRDGIATLDQPKDKPCGPEDEIDPLAKKRVYLTLARKPICFRRMGSS